MLNLRVADAKVVGRSRLTHRRHPCALVAQGTERRFPKPCVAGSSPAGGAKSKAGLMARLLVTTGEKADFRPQLLRWVGGRRGCPALELIQVHQEGTA